MEERSDFREWDELIPDALGLIFKNLSLFEVLTVVPRVCKSWGRAVTGPYCWREIDIEEWSRNHEPEIIDRMLHLLISRACGSLSKLSVSGLANDNTIMLIANHAQSLQTLQLPRSEISYSIMEKVAEKLSALTSLDLSYCPNIGARALEAIGNHCKSLTTLRRVMHPLEVIDKLSQDDEALAIAATMPKLKHLEIAYLLVDTSSVVEILEKCKHLELLDVRGCWNVNLDDGFLRKFPELKVMGPLIEDCYEIWDDCTDDDDDDYEETLDDLWEGENCFEDDVEMWFYDDVNALDGGYYDWPRSP